jgi:peroxiredoxin
VIEAGAMAADFSLGNFSLSRELKLGPVLLVLFKVSCPTCQFTLPFIERLHGRGLRVWGISQDDEESTRELTDHLGITFPILRDAEGYPVSNAYGISSVPSMFLVEANGSVSWSLNGFHKAKLETLGERVGGSPFREAERVPAMRPG